jgi:hypothetical protein
VIAKFSGVRPARQAQIATSYTFLNMTEARETSALTISASAATTCCTAEAHPRSPHATRGSSSGLWRKSYSGRGCGLSAELHLRPPEHVRSPSQDRGRRPSVMPRRVWGSPMRARDHGCGEPAGAHIWTVEAVRQLGMTTDVDTAAAILGIGRTLAFELAKADRFPVRLLRLGRRVLVPVPDLLRFLGAGDPQVPSEGVADAGARRRP